jgi:hypothetical protein
MRGVQELPRGVVVLLERSARVGAAGRYGPMGGGDGTGLVRYADSSANLRVLLLMG